MDDDFERLAHSAGLSYRRLWDDADLAVVLELGERYLASTHPTPERTILMGLLLRLRQLEARFHER